MRIQLASLFAFGIVSLAACGVQPGKESRAPSALAPKAEAGQGSKEASLAGKTWETDKSAHYDAPTIPTSLPGLPGVPTSMPGLPSLPGGGTSGGGDFEGLNFKLPPCPPIMQGVTFGAGVTGTIYMPKGDMALGAAKVTLVNALGAEQATTLSDGCGRFRFDGILPGVYKVRFAVRTFRGESQVSVPAGGINVDLRVDVKFLNVAVFQGSWDHVEKILDKVGVPYTLMPNSKLEDADLSKFNVIFINCNETSESTVSENVKGKLKGFVGGGGALYVSDRALPYILATWPGQVNAKGNTGASGTKKHTIFDFQLGSYLRGALTVPIIYDLGAWRQLDKTQPPTTLALLRDEKTQEPAILTFAYQNGFVGYTTYHQGAQMNDAMTFSLVFFITRL